MQAPDGDPADLVDVSDSSPPQQRQRSILTDPEAHLVATLKEMPPLSLTHDLLPHFDKSLFSVFKSTLKDAPNMYSSLSVFFSYHSQQPLIWSTPILYSEHLTRCGYLLDNNFFLELAEPQNWVSTLVYTSLPIITCFLPLSYYILTSPMYILCSTWRF